MRFDQFLKEACPPLDLEWRKYRRAAARRRVDQRLKELDLPDYAAYLERIRSDAAEAAGLAERMRVTLSRFYRERERWEVLRRTALPQILRGKAPDEPLRIWSAGCCGGEEPYTLALLWLEHFKEKDPDRPLEILATDIDTASLERARLGVYQPGSIREVPREILQRHFRRQGQDWHLDAQVKAMVRFARQDLMRTPPPRAMDLVCCRYLVFTYFGGRRRLRAARRLRQALHPAGALMIARKEDLGTAEELFEPWPGAEGLYRRR